MRRLTMFLVVSSLTVVGRTVPAAASAPLPSQQYTYRVIIDLSGDEYHDARNNVVPGPRQAECPAPPGAPVPMGCWTWTSKRLGHGTYTLSEPSLQGARLVWTFTYTDSRGQTLTGNLAEGYIPDPSPSDALTHANRYPATYTFTGGTGRFAGVTGNLMATATTTKVEVDRSTGTAHSKFASRSAGRLTFPSKL